MDPRDPTRQYRPLRDRPYRETPPWYYDRPEEPRCAECGARCAAEGIETRGETRAYCADCARDYWEGIL